MPFTCASTCAIHLEAYLGFKCGDTSFLLSDNFQAEEGYQQLQPQTMLKHSNQYQEK